MSFIKHIYIYISLNYIIYRILCYLIIDIFANLYIFFSGLVLYFGNLKDYVENLNYWYWCVVFLEFDINKYF